MVLSQLAELLSRSSSIIFGYTLKHTYSATHLGRLPDPSFLHSLSAFHCYVPPPWCVHLLSTALPSRGSPRDDGH